MAKLIINPTSSSRREVPLARTLLSIGRDPSNDLVLPDALVSRRHAVIECRGDQYFIRDCNSSNGSLVNGDRVTEHALKDGDLMAIGTARMLFRVSVEVEDAAAKVVQHPSSPRLSCTSCKADYRKGDLFCRQCGQALPPPAPADVACPSCGKNVPLPAKFCTGCGTSLSPSADSAAPAQIAVAPSVPAPAPASAPRNEALEPTRPRPMPVPSPAESASSAGGAEPASEAPPEVEMRVPTPLMAGAGALQAPPVVIAKPAAAPAVAPHPREAEVEPLSLAIRPLRPTIPPPHPIGLRSPVSTLPAPFGPRLLAFLVDNVLVTAAQAVLVAPAAYYFYRWYHEAQVAGGEPDFVPVLLSVALITIAVILGGGYYVYFWGVTGATPGKRMMGLLVEGADGTRPIGVGRAFLRLLGYALSGTVLGLGFFMIAISGHGLHDRLASTRVVPARGRS